MCGRYDLSESGRALRIGDALLTLEGSRPRYNVAPLQRAPVVRGDDGQLVLDEARWGLVPGWAKDASGAARCINARSETVADKPMFRTAFRKRRCLVPADGYFEWEASPSGKLPWRFVRQDRQPLLFAGLWETWHPPAGTDPTLELKTFTILTTAARDQLAEIHDRMPVIFNAQSAQLWIDPATDVAVLSALVQQTDHLTIERYRVSTVVNSSRNDTPDCVKPAIVQGDLLGGWAP